MDMPITRRDDVGIDNDNVIKQLSLVSVTP